MFNITVLGGQGSGKGTQVPTIIDYYKNTQNLTHLTTGGLCRDEISSGSELGKTVSTIINKGNLLSDDLIFEMLANKLSDMENTDGVVFDGVPRNLEQAKMLDDLLSNFDSKIHLALFIEVPIQELLERITGRRICPKCKSNYHIKYIPPKEPGICDKDGEKLTQREDDADKEAVKQRLSIFEKNNQDILNYYKETGRLLTINGNQPIEDVGKEIIQKLSSKS